MTDLLIPYAFDFVTRNIVYPDRARPSSRYRCPECEGLLGVKSGARRRPHFFHLRVEAQCPFREGGGEGGAHVLAKHALHAWLLRWLAGEYPPPVLEAVCPRHNRSFPIPLIKPSEAKVRIEHKLNSGRVLDVALIEADQVTIGFEIRASHPVDRDKAGALECPWIELDAGSLSAAYAKLEDGQSVAALKVLRYADSFRAPCCLPFEVMHAAVRIEPPPVPEVFDKTLADAAGQAAARGLDPWKFATGFANKHGKQPIAIVKRLHELGFVKADSSTWS